MSLVVSIWISLLWTANTSSHHHHRSIIITEIRCPVIRTQSYKEHNLCNHQLFCNNILWPPLTQLKSFLALYPLPLVTQIQCSHTNSAVSHFVKCQIHVFSNPNLGPREMCILKGCTWPILQFKTSSTVYKSWLCSLYQINLVKNDDPNLVNEIYFTGTNFV